MEKRGFVKLKNSEEATFWKLSQAFLMDSRTTKRDSIQKTKEDRHALVKWSPALVGRGSGNLPPSEGEPFVLWLLWVFCFSSICRGAAIQEWMLPGVCAITHTQPWGPSRGRGSPYSHSCFWSRYELGKFYLCLCFSKSSPSRAGYLRSTAFLRRPS